MNRKTLSLVTVLTIACAAAWAQGPNNSGTYYQAANGQKGAALKTALHNIISKKKHSPSYDELLELYKKTDTRPDGKVRDWYSNTTNFTHIADKAGSYKKEGDVYNREHTVPQSWGPPKADIMHVVPTDGYVNNRRGNLPFGEVGNATYTSNNSYCKLGSCKTPGYTGTVFEPNDEVKGDIARIYFYMATCYEDQAPSWSGVFGGSKYQPMQAWTYDMMVRWSKLDPVDDVERARNNAVAQSDVQGNRNPFVDYPGLEDYVWGSKLDVAFNYTQSEGGSGTPYVNVAQPVFSVEAGTYSEAFSVTMSCATSGAAIYYTTDGTDPSAQSTRYTAAVTISQTTTLKAVAVKDGNTSSVTTATYVVGSSQGPAPESGTIVLNNTFFGTNHTGSVNVSNTTDFVGTQNGVTVVYSLGTGSNRYINSEHIRLYQKNTLTFSVAEGTLTSIAFTLATTTTKTLHANTGTVQQLQWTGNAKEVVFSVDEGSGNMQLASAKVTVSTPSGIGAPSVKFTQQKPIYNLQGQRVKQPKKGIYIKNKRKVYVR